MGAMVPGTSVPEKMVESGPFPDLTLDEINEEIRLAREERAAREKAGV